MKKLTWIAIMLAMLPSMFLGTQALAQLAAVLGSPEDTKAIEMLVHSNPSDHVTEDVSFPNIFGTVRFGREEFIERHKQIGQTFFKATTAKSSDERTATTACPQPDTAHGLQRPSHL